MSRPCRVVHMLSEQPHATTRSAPRISAAAGGEANPPIPSRYHGAPAKSPLATADVASSAPHRSASSANEARAPRAPRPATNTGRSADDTKAANEETADGDGTTTG